MKIETCVNTPDEVLFGNVFTNSRRAVPWVKSVPEHDGQAILVGGGHSTKDWLHEIKWRQGLGQTVFALNGAARFLSESGIRPDYTVVLDARAPNIGFLGFSDKYLLASQCHPSLFEWGGDIALWHQDYPDNAHEFAAAIPNDSPDYSAIGGGTTVGLSGMVLAYGLGFRKLHLYGYDSCFRDGETHAYSQTDPQAVPCVNTVEGRQFHTTLSMAQQAEFFPLVSDMLIDAGCLITMRGDGLLQWISQMSSRPTAQMTEAEKYRAMWERPEYRAFAPGESVADLFCKVAKPESQIVDLGAGTGRGALKIHETTHLPVHMLDLVENCLDADVRALLSDEFTFQIHDLTSQGRPGRFGWGYCTDVMEHLPPDSVDAALESIFAIAPRVFFQISTVNDAMGALIHQKLHLTVKPSHWWREKLSRFGVIEWESVNGEDAIFYIVKP